MSQNTFILISLIYLIGWYLLLFTMKFSNILIIMLCSSIIWYWMIHNVRWAQRYTLFLEQLIISITKKLLQQ